MRIVAADTDAAAERLDRSATQLARQRPQVSASRLLTGRQRIALAVVAAAVVIGCIVRANATGIVLISLAVLAYMAIVADRIWLYWRSTRSDSVLRVTDREALAIADDDLPVYTVLVPLYGEPTVVRQLLDQLGGISYPSDRLDVKLLLEADDHDTIEAVERCAPGDEIEVVLVPPGDPRTKPKALNYLSLIHI